MATYLIGYEGRGTRPYDRLQEAIDERGGKRILEGMWGLDLEEDATQVRDWLHGFMDDEDAIFVIQLKKEHHWATRHVKASVNDWLKTRI